MTIGNQLKKAREKRQITINEIFQLTRIHPDILSALEEDRYDKVNKAYVRSFLKEYAAFLGLKVDKILKEYDNLHPKEAPSFDMPMASEEEAPRREIDREKILSILKVVAISILAVIMLVYFVKTTIWIKRSISAKMAERAKQAQIRKEQKLEEQKKEQAQPAKETSQKKKRDLPKPQPKGPQEISIPASERLKLKITVTDDVWIQLKADGNIVSQIVLKKGSAEAWDADESFTLWTGNAAAMQINLNGTDLGSPGRGVIRDIVIDRSGIKK